MECRSRKEARLSRAEQAQYSLRADPTDSLKTSEVPPPVKYAHQRHKACSRSLVVPMLEEPNLIGVSITSFGNSFDYP